MRKPPLFRWSVEDYERLIKLGILTENHKVELIRGEIVEKMSIGDLHGWCVDILNRLFNRAAGELALVSVQNAIRLADSEPEPDIVLRVLDLQRKEKARPHEILLLVEVADSSLEYDREEKRPVYAENGIAEYWIVNLIDNCVEVYRDPRPDGTYSSVQIFKKGESLALLKLQSITVAIADILP